ncbi:ElaA protein [Agreia bicolorata]|uniref:ElaA protein n=1 Tax=Agreia bicolorata TaxID=110935 RepID=A0A1T4XS91_9MICO|nr:GNAT family N-acetyltransferase [Agreia bicolorata]SKA91925.1 ElaA protein [Agreia bicolorata]
MPLEPIPAIVQKRWSELTTAELYEILKLRTDVFYVEQKVDESELDRRDRESTTEHLWIPGENDDVAAYLRVLHDEVAEHEDAHLLPGRVVVGAAYRGQGLAQRLLARVVELHGSTSMLLHSQSYITGLYATFGFVAVGDEFVEAGIPHRTMFRAGR